MKITDKTYDFIKNILLPLLTGMATFIITVGKIWGINYYEQVAGTLSALATLISFVINQASKAYFSDKEIVDATVDRNVDKG